MRHNTAGESFQHSKQPLYQQLATVFRRLIETGEWPRGEKLPSIESLMTQFGTARVTVRSAFAELVAEGLVSSARGKGSFVAPARPEAEIRFPLAYTWEALVEFGRHSTLEVVTEAADEHQSLPAWCPHEGVPAEGYHRLERVYLHGEVRVCFSLVYLASDIWKRWRHRFEDRAIATVFGETPELELGEGLQTVTIISAGDDSAGNLRIPVGSPIAEVIRRVYAPDQRLLYWSRVHFPSKFVRMDFKLR